MKRKGMMTLLSLLVVAGLCAPALAAADLVETLPRNVVAMVRVTGLHDLWKEFVNSSAFAKLERGPIPDIAAGIRQAREEINQFELQTGVDVEDGLSAIFGTDIVVAAFPDQTAVFVARTADTGGLQFAVDTILSIEHDEGKLSDETTQYHQGAEIRSAVVTNPKTPGASAKERHHAISGDFLLVSENLDAVRRTLDVLNGAQPSLASTAEYREAAKLMRQDALIRFYVDTDHLSEIQDLEALFNGGMRNPVVSMFARRMKQILPVTKYAVGNLAASDAGAELRYSFVYDGEKLPDSLKALLPAKGAPLDIMRFVPGSSVLALANRVNKLALWQYLLESVSERHPQVASRISLQVARIGPVIGGMDFEKELLPQIGDQAGFIVTPGGGDHPPAVSLVIELNNGQTIPMALRTLAGSVAAITQIEADKAGVEPKAVMRRTTYRETDLTTLVLTEEKLAGKLNPTMFVHDKFMVVSTSPEAARAIIEAVKSPGTTATGSRLGRTAFGKAGLNVTGLAGMIRDNLEFLVREGQKKGKAEQRARSDLDALLFLMGFFERVDAEAFHAPGRIDRVVRVRYAPAKPGE